MKLVVVLHNIRSTHNVGAILRTCDGFGVERVVFGGYTPYPGRGLPHEGEKLRQQIHKTALGAEDSVRWDFAEDVMGTIRGLREEGYEILALEQDERSVELGEFAAKGDKCVLVLGEEVAGICRELLDEADTILEIPMVGAKESFNVSVAAGVAMWEITRG